MLDLNIIKEFKDLDYKEIYKFIKDVAIKDKIIRKLIIVSDIEGEHLFGSVNCMKTHEFSNIKYVRIVILI